jgi:AraC-like DNA-binding protein
MVLSSEFTADPHDFHGKYILATGGTKDVGQAVAPRLREADATMPTAEDERDHHYESRSDPRSDVRLTVQAPCVELRPFVKEFLITESAGEYTQVLLPETGAIAVFRFNGSSLRQGEFELPTSVLSGLQDSARILKRPANTSVIITRFTESGARAFLREPLDLLFDTTMSMDQLFPRSEVGRIEDQLVVAKQHNDRFLILQRFLLGHMRREPPDQLVSAVVAKIKEVNGDVRIGLLARNSGLSQSALERRFRKTVGTSLRRFASIVRLRHIIRLQKHTGNLTEIAYAAGYFDQAHFIKDFKRFTSQAPLAFFRQSSFC